MMARNEIERMFGDLIGSTAARLAPLGFRRRVRVMRMVVGAHCGIVEFQRSAKSSNQQIFFTVNVGVVYGELLGPGPSELDRAQIADAHVRQRIGMIMPGRSDRWWEINQSTDIGALKREVSEVVIEYALPFVRRYLSTDAIISLWESGQSPGLTAVQRADFLSQLKSKHKDGVS